MAWPTVFPVYYIGSPQANGIGFILTSPASTIELAASNGFLRHSWPCLRPTVCSFLSILSLFYFCPDLFLVFLPVSVSGTRLPGIGCGLSQVGIVLLSRLEASPTIPLPRHLR